MLSTSAFLALTLQCAASIHPDTAQDVARIESGFNPYAIAEIIPKAERLPGDKGVITHLPKSKGEALNIVKNIKKKNRRYSVGLMQITSTNFSKFGMTADKLFSPCNNLSVFEKIITDCYLRGTTLERALSCYYSGNFNTGKKPEKSFGNTSYVQRIGYVVPSTKEDKQSIQTEPEKINISTFYPHEVVRGDVIDSTQSETETIKYPAHIVRGDFVITENKETNK
ncbi:lytic transglycosylase domain-containing protein [Hafnia alvei]|uniref:lytic transglycosylase domain-containing protein n=1 Tax=Hafnia alvei TaxID=569 RepID=UPI000DFC9FA2|nr:lytic transglycosylase domain-containing protein [Hafnia alvei]STR94730.1 type IV secretion system lytic transglycosylase VirB1 [Hafnia alvei]